MSKSKKPIIYITCFFLVLSSVIIPYYNSKASELAIATGLASSGTALLALLAMSGVGMEIENNRKFNDLSDEEKDRIQNGLAQNFEEVALQRGASLEKIKTWTSDLCSGVLDKTSECWDIFKDWAKNISISDGTNSISQDGAYISETSLIGVSFVDYNGNTVTIDSNTINNIKSYASRNFFNNKIGYYIVSTTNSAGYSYSLYAIYDYSSNNYISYPNSISCVRMTTNGMPYYSYATSGHFSITTTEINNNTLKTVIASKPVYPYDASNNEPITSINLSGLGVSGNELFSTNTDYLERLKGQEKEQVEIIDVTDIKNPIVESKGNSISRIDWNRGTNNNNNNNDDDEQTIKGGLVPADVWYESLDDYIDGQNNAIETYDEHISENPEDKDKYFISPSPIVNISQFYDVLPVVSVPVGGTIVNNYYTYNNYNTFNNTIYNEPYNPELVPNIPMLVFENKFPFCIPWDIFNFVSAFYVEKEAPRIDIPFPIKGSNGLDIQTVTIDLSGYEYLSTIIRVMFFVLFLVGLMILTRQLIKG